jgi:FtsH-binding integral membrane protein
MRPNCVSSTRSIRHERPRYHPRHLPRLRLASTGAGTRNKRLRNTYWLLALSLIPTVLGAWVGVATGITRRPDGGLGLIVFLGGAFGFMFAIEKTKNSAAGVPCCWRSPSSWA